MDKIVARDYESESDVGDCAGWDPVIVDVLNRRKQAIANGDVIFPLVRKPTDNVASSAGWQDPEIIESFNHRRQAIANGDLTSPSVRESTNNAVSSAEVFDMCTSVTTNLDNQSINPKVNTVPKHSIDDEKKNDITKCIETIKLCLSTIESILGQ